MRLIYCILLMLFISQNVISEEDPYKDLVPEEYTDEEFHPLLRDLRRAEVILAGSYPFSILFTKLGMDMYDYASSGFSRDRAPSIFGGTEKQSRNSEETGRLLLSALYVSIGITAADFIIGRIKDRKADEKKRYY